MTRTRWDELPPAVRGAVGAHVGTVTDWAPVGHGLICQVAVVLSTTSGRVFVKGVPVADQEGVAAQAVETVVNSWTLTAGPHLRAHVQAGGWDVLLFDAVDGRHADLSPGSPDVPLVTEVLHRAQGGDAGGVVPRLADRFAGVLDGGRLQLLDGDRLLHTDTNPHNLLITGGRAVLVDWAMAAAGPAWVDVAYLAVRLMEADWSPVDALVWADQFPSWRDAAPAAVRAFVDVTCRAWAARVGKMAARSSNGRYRALLAPQTAA